MPPLTRTPFVSTDPALDRKFHLDERFGCWHQLRTCEIDQQKPDKRRGDQRGTLSAKAVLRTTDASP
jgi:hypothetical protein